MLWMTEKLTARHTFDFGFRRVTTPIQVKIEYQVAYGVLVAGSLTMETLYNRPRLLELYPRIEPKVLDQAIEQSARQAVDRHLEESGVKPWAGDREA
jgi:hypothetical protein